MTAPYYCDDLVSLYHGDCLEVRDWLAADVLVTDPPYGIGWKKGLNKAAGSRRHDGIRNDEDTAARDAMHADWGAVRPGLMFGSLYAPAPADVRHILIWEKPTNAGIVGAAIGFRRDVEAVYLVGKWPPANPSRGSVLHYAGMGSGNGPGLETGHPHAKPVRVMGELLDVCPPGIVADPFAGSGSTLVAAKLQGRKAIGVEIDERYCEIAARRLAQGVLL